MNVKSVEKKEKSTVELVIEIGKEEFEAAVEKVYKKQRGKIIARRITGTCAKHQRLLSTEIKRARQMALLFYTAGHSSDVKKKSNI